MASAKTYVDLTPQEEKKANELKQDCQDIINIVSSISINHQDAAEFIIKLENILIKGENIAKLLPQIRNLKSSIEQSL